VPVATRHCPIGEWLDGAKVAIGAGVIIASGLFIALRERYLRALR
jgi:hypothetical protein